MDLNLNLSFTGCLNPAVSVTAYLGIRFFYQVENCCIRILGKNIWCCESSASLLHNALPTAPALPTAAQGSSCLQAPWSNSTPRVSFASSV